MPDITVLKPNVGIASIGWRESGRTTLPGPEETGGMFGGRVKQRLWNLYDQVTTKEIARDMTVPHTDKPDLLLPHVFDVAFLNTTDKMQALAAADPKANHRALSHLRRIKKVREVWRHNVGALQLV